MPVRSSLARLQQALVIGVGMAALAWLIGSWPHSPWLALAGALALVAVHAWFLAFEFILMGLVGGDDPTPRASVAQRARAWVHETWVGWQVFGWRQPFAWRAVPDSLDEPSVQGRRGVVLIHGFVCNRGFWTPWLKRLRAQNRAFVAVNLEPVFGDIDSYAAIVERAVSQVEAATGLPPLLVCHSMGGLVARAWLRSCGPGAPRVWHVVTLGSPHRGTWLARWSRKHNGRQMRVGGEWLALLEQSEQSVPRPGLFTCWYSNCDNIVFPHATATLPGADNRLLLGAGHVDLAFRRPVIEATLRLLDT